MEQLSGVVERITYSNEQNGYAVVKIKSKGFPDLVTVVGTLATVRVGSTIRVTGDWKVDTKFGRQFSATSFEETVPATLAGLEKYLGSGLIKGIGPEFAKKIVKTFRNDTLRVLDETPEQLNRVPGIGQKRIALIRKAWAEQQEIKNLMLFLQDHDVSTHYAGKIYKAYGNAAIQTVTDNPFRLADDIWGIGFRTADAIAKKLGVDPLAYARCRSGILYVMNELSGQGHCFVTRPQLEKACEKLLELPVDVLATALSQMARDRDILVEHPDQPAGLRLTETASEAIGDRNALLWLPVFWYAEAGVATRLLALMGQPSPYCAADPEPILIQAEQETGLIYDPVQREAVRRAISAKCTVLTGGPGTGKTTTTLAILRAFEAFGARVLLAAPTGRAAKRLSETTGKEARTIHRLLEYKPPEGAARNAENPLDCDVLVVDETSMVDILLLYDLLKAVPETAVLLLVGDVDQLPSVGPGNILLDVMDSERAAVVRLTRIFRQAEGSAIIRNAHRIDRKSVV